MNKEYMVLDGKTIVSSDTDGLKVVPNYQNPEEVLKQENLIEIIDKKINELFEKKKNTQPEKYSFTKGIGIKLYIVLCPILLGFIFKYIFGVDPGYVATKIGTIPFCDYLSIISIWLCISNEIVNLTLGRYLDNRRCKEEREACDSSIEYLQKRKGEEERKLYAITHNNIVSQEEKVNTGSIRIHDSEALAEIERFVHVNYHGRLNLKKYYRRYLEGNLQFTLKKEGELNDLDNYLDFIEEKGPRLIKNFRTSDKY